MTPGPDGPVVFFDGYCPLCNGFADFMIRRDRRRRFRFAPLQGETAASWIPEDAATPDAGAPRSIVLRENGTTLRKSDAVLRAVAGLGGGWRVVRLLRLIPPVLRDAVYDFVARHRYRWFGKMGACRVPAPAEQVRFLP
jgi:predicted DCC family thiol-disulfide oxidoreductase YuxK